MLSTEKGLKSDMERHLKDQVLLYYLLFIIILPQHLVPPRESSNRLSCRQQEFVADCPFTVL